MKSTSLKKYAIAVFGIASLILAGCGNSATGANASQGSNSKTTEATASSSSGTPTSESGRSSSEIKIGFLTYNRKQVFFTQLIAGAEAQAKEEGVELVVFDPDGDQVQQNNAIENYVNQGFNVIIVDAIDVEGVKPALKKAKDAGLYVISVDQLIDDPLVDVNVGVDNKVAGARLGDFFNEWASKNIDGAPELGIVGTLASSIQVQRQDGFEGAVTKAGATIAQVVDGKNDPDAAFSVAETLITGHPKMDAIYTTSGSSNIGAISALKSQGQSGRIPIFGWDLSSQLIDAIDRGDVIAAVEQNPAEESRKAVSAAVALMNGKKVERFIDVPVDIVTKDNVNDYRSTYN